MTEPNNLDETTVSIFDTLQEEVDTTNRELREVSLMLDQSQVEVEKLSQRNATITMHLQQVSARGDEVPLAEIRNAYDAALDAQQRLVGMRGQLEKLQSDQAHLDRYLTMMRQIQASLLGEGGNGIEGMVDGGNFAKAEMVIQAQETERKRLSSQMHDGPAQALSNFILQTEIAMRLFEVDQERAREELSNLKGAASKTFQQVRDFIFDLRPMMLDDLGLSPTVKQYCNSFREKHPVELNVTITGTDRRLESTLEVLFFRAMQELLNFAVVNNQANQIKVLLDMGDRIRMDIEDDGTGFNPEKIETDEATIGLKVIRDRVEMLGGEITIDSAIGQGSRFNMSVPDINKRISSS